MDDWLGELTDSELLACAVAEHPAFRTGAELDRIDPQLLSAGERVDLLSVLEEQRRWFDAAQLRLLASMQAADTTELGLGQEGVSLALQLPLRTAQTKLAQAATLVTELPRTLAAVSDGSISAGHAAVLAEAVWRMPDDPVLPAALENTVLPPVLAAGCVTVPQLRRRVRRAVLALDPGTAEQRQQRALTERRVEYQPGEDGMASLSVWLGAPEAQLIYARLTTAAGLLPAQDPRTLDQQRADLLVDGLLSGLPADALPVVQGRRPAIQVTVAADTLLGLNDQPAHLTGYGPITADTARRLAAEESGTWRRLLTDPDTGALLDISEHRYRPPQRLRDFVSARDDTCAFPTCQQPSYRCEPDHTVPFAQGGPTRRDNLAPTCRRHNQAKTTGTGWSYRHNQDGSYTWTTSTGHHYTSPPTKPWPIPPDGTRLPEKEIHRRSDMA
ncbi:MAG TPA: DUF222 domain-containing protein [Jatrophihabitans sp.]|nr:DUF222 domain-containing protein [Jatrophihabitans sp.]